jgi:dTDP-glucose 4,6-dehydratase
LNAINNHAIPVYGTGDNMREWIHAADHCRAILTVLQQGKSGEVYNIGTHDIMKNIDLVKKVLEIVERKHSLIEFVEDRKAHDFIYAIDSSKMRNELKWEPRINFEAGLKQTIAWYKNIL